jgi:hypothetical protein
MCKRLLDYGRLLYLRDLGFEARMIHYCPEDVTPENALLIAWCSSVEKAESSADVSE